MDGKTLRQALRAGKRVYGTLIASASPDWPVHVAGLDLDFVFIDTEHKAIDRTTLSWMCRTYSALNLAPIVRIPSPDPYEATIVLDAGASGVIAPYVETAEQVKALRGAVKLRNLKGQKLQQVLNSPWETVVPELADYLTERNQSNVLIINIESVPAMQALDDLLTVPGLDAILIGPHDLASSLDIPEHYSHPIFDQAVRTIIQTARARSVGAGIHFATGAIEQEIGWIEAGANLIIHKSDLTVFREAMKRDIGALKKAVVDT